jgi:HAD superfamily hydrolase (TIGR01450 family)
MSLSQPSRRRKFRMGSGPLRIVPRLRPMTLGPMTSDEAPATWVIDLDGVVWRGRDPIAGSADTIAWLQDQGHRVVFASNNSAYTAAELEAKLNAHGIRSLGHAITSSQAASSLLRPGETVLVVGEAGVVEAVEAAGAVVRAEGPVETVIVGITPRFDYAMLRSAARALHGGARLIATNTDSTFPGPDGLDPGNGSLVAAVATAGGKEPEAVAGKPHRPMAELILARYGPVGVMVGDRADTDGQFARTLGYDFALVLSGVVTAADLPVDPAPRWLATDLAHLVARPETSGVAGPL